MGDEMSKRERELLDILYERGGATAVEVQEALGDDTSNSAVRTLLGILEQKGFALHEREGKRFVYKPRVPAGEAGRSALRRAVRTFFSNSASGAIAALVDGGELGRDEIERIEALLRKAKDADRGEAES